MGLFDFLGNIPIIGDITNGLGLTNTNAQHQQQQQQGLANQYGGQAAAGYNNLAGYGSQDYNQGLSMLGQYLPQLLQAAGLQPQQQSGLNPYQYIAPGGTPGVQPQQGGAPSPGGRVPGVPQDQQNPQGGQAQGQQQADMYALTPAQQQQLNLQVGDINQRRTSALSELQAEFANRGISDPRAMAAAQTHLHGLFDNMATGAQAQFAESARTARENALNGLIGLSQGIQARGSGETGQAASGLGGLAGAATNNANFQQGQVNQASNQFGTLLGSIFGGALGGPAAGALGGTPSITPIGGGQTYGSGGLGGGGTLNGGAWTGGFGSSSWPVLY